MVRMYDGSYQIIKIAELYVSQLKRILIYPHVIDTQEGNPVFFEVCGRWNRVKPYWAPEVLPNKEVWVNILPLIQITIMLKHIRKLPIFQFYLPGSEDQSHQVLEASL